MSTVQDVYFELPELTENLAAVTRANQVLLAAALERVHNDPVQACELLGIDDPSAKEVPSHDKKMAAYTILFTVQQTWFGTIQPPESGVGYQLANAAMGRVAGSLLVRRLRESGESAVLEFGIDGPGELARARRYFSHMFEGLGPVQVTPDKGDQGIARESIARLQTVNQKWRQLLAATTSSTSTPS